RRPLRSAGTGPGRSRATAASRSGGVGIVSDSGAATRTGSEAAGPVIAGVEDPGIASAPAGPGRSSDLGVRGTWAWATTPDAISAADQSGFTWRKQSEQ